LTASATYPGLLASAEGDRVIGQYNVARAVEKGAVHQGAVLAANRVGDVRAGGFIETIRLVRMAALADSCRLTITPRTRVMHGFGGVYFHGLICFDWFDFAV